MTIAGEVVVEQERFVRRGQDHKSRWVIGVTFQQRMQLPEKGIDKDTVARRVDVGKVASSGKQSLKLARRERVRSGCPNQEGHPDQEVLNTLYTMPKISVYSMSFSRTTLLGIFYAKKCFGGSKVTRDLVYMQAGVFPGRRAPTLLLNCSTRAACQAFVAHDGRIPQAAFLLTFYDIESMAWWKGCLATTMQLRSQWNPKRGADIQSSFIQCYPIRSVSLESAQAKHSRTPLRTVSRRERETFDCDLSRPPPDSQVGV
ncbi:hypothetical protein CPB85DRAFT_1457107 [Mucidula mucida]|nr:hypothetical protein CPB85DRAFT_1457107 [Mucidula mucida]